MIRLRELSRLDDELAQEQNRAINRLREQFHRIFPQLLQLSECADETWLWNLFEMAPSPLRAARLTEARIARLLKQHRIRRLTAAQVQTVLKSKPLHLAPGAAEAAAEHALWLLPRLRLLHRQRTDLARRRGANERLRNALYHWARVSVVCDPQSKKRYAAMRACGQSHGRALRGMSDRWLKVLTSMLTTRTLYDPQRRLA
jgi:transposase